jgi:xanthosine utilization system XapX-like protein
MKQKFLVGAVTSGLVCVVLALWPARSLSFDMAAYVGMSVGALLALLRVEKPWRWLAIVVLLFGLMGVLVNWPSEARNLKQTRPAGAAAWIQWSSSVGGNNVIGQSWLVGTPRCGVRTAQRAVPTVRGPP